MSESVCVVKNVPPKANDEMLTKLFSTYGSVKSTYVNRDANTAEITFSRKDEAQKACAEMNDKEILKVKVQVCLKDDDKSLNVVKIINLFFIVSNCIIFILKTKNESSSSIFPQFDFDKENVGNIIYPLAKRKYASHAAKLTGMIVESILALQSEPLMLSIIHNEKTLMELVKKLFILFSAILRHSSFLTIVLFCSVRDLFFGGNTN